MKRQDIHIPQEINSNSSNEENKKMARSSKPGIWNFSSSDESSSVSDRKGKAPASDELKDLHKGNAAGKDSQPPREREAESVQEEEREDPMSEYKREVQHLLPPWLRDRDRNLITENIAKYLYHRDEKMVSDVETEFRNEVMNEVTVTVQTIIDNMPPDLQKKLYNHFTGMPDEPDTISSRFYRTVHNLYQQVRSRWSSMPDESDTVSSRGEDEPFRTKSPERNSTSDELDTRDDRSFDNRKSRESESHLDQRASTSDSEWASASDSSLTEDEGLASTKSHQLEKDEMQLECQLKQKVVENSTVLQKQKELEATISSQQLEPEHLREELAAISQRSLTSQPETTVENSEKHPASDNPQDQGQGSSGKDSKTQKRQTAKRASKNFSWAGITGICRNSRDIHVEQVHTPKSKFRQKERNNSTNV